MKFSGNGFWITASVVMTVLNAVFFFSNRLEAAPSDIKGSANVAVASYSTSKGSYTLWSSGRITSLKTGKQVAPPYDSGTPEGLQLATKAQKEPLGSPKVAVDYLQNPKGTYTLWADGSISKATDLGASAPRGGQTKIFYAYRATPATMSLPTYIVSGFRLDDRYDGTVLENTRIQRDVPNLGSIPFNEEFTEPPLVFYSVAPSSPSGQVSGVSQVGLEMTGATARVGDSFGVTVAEKDRLSLRGATFNHRGWDGRWLIVIGQ